MNNKNRRGFSLIELMIALAIIGILSAIAIPSYTAYIQRAHRADAKSMLLQNAQFLERNYTETTPSSYALNSAGAAITFANLPVQQSPASGTALYTIGLNNTIAPAGAAAGTFYTLSATPVGAQATDPCGVLSINQNGAKNYTPPAGSTYSLNDCWSK